MPLEKCKKGGKSGWKWGDSGACYVGPGAKKKAIKQGIAIEGPKKFKTEVARGGEDAPLIEAALAEYEAQRTTTPTYTDDLVESVRVNLSGGGEFEAEHEEAFASLTKKERDKVPREDFAWPEARKFPVTDQAHLDAAVRLLGRAPKDKQAAIKRRIISIAKRKGLKLPEGWGGD